MKRKVLLIYTGGTIGMEKDYETGSLVAFDFSTIFKRIPEMNLLECEVSVHPFEKPVDSSDMGPQEWRMIAEWIYKNYENFDGFLILHGTDTMSYTASALSFYAKESWETSDLDGLSITDWRFEDGCKGKSSDKSVLRKPL